MFSFRIFIVVVTSMSMLTSTVEEKDTLLATKFVDYDGNGSRDKLQVYQVDYNKVELRLFDDLIDSPKRFKILFSAELYSGGEARIEDVLDVGNTGTINTIGLYLDDAGGARIIYYFNRGYGYVEYESLSSIIKQHGKY